MENKIYRGKYLKKIADDRGIPLSHLAKIAGTSLETIYTISKRNGRIGFRIAVRLAAILGEPIERFTGIEPDFSKIENAEDREKLIIGVDWLVGKTVWDSEYIGENSEIEEVKCGVVDSYSVTEDSILAIVAFDQDEDADNPIFQVVKIAEFGRHLFLNQEIAEQKWKQKTEQKTREQEKRAKTKGRDNIFENNILTIRQAAERAKAEGIGIPEHFIRVAVKEGSIRAVQSGRKNLLYYPNVFEYFIGKPYQKPTCGTQINTQKGEEDEG